MGNCKTITTKTLRVDVGKGRKFSSLGEGVKRSPLGAGYSSAQPGQRETSRRYSLKAEGKT